MDIGEEALTGVLKGIVDAVLEFNVRRVLFFSGHGGNWPALQARRRSTCTSAEVKRPRSTGDGPARR